MFIVLDGSFLLHLEGKRCRVNWYNCKITQSYTQEFIAEYRVTYFGQKDIEENYSDTEKNNSTEKLLYYNPDQSTQASLLRISLIKKYTCTVKTPIKRPLYFHFLDKLSLNQSGFLKD